MSPCIFGNFGRFKITHDKWRNGYIWFNGYSFLEVHWSLNEQLEGRGFSTINKRSINFPWLTIQYSIDSPCQRQNRIHYLGILSEKWSNLRTPFAILGLVGNSVTSDLKERRRESHLKGGEGAKTLPNQTCLAFCGQWVFYHPVISLRINWGELQALLRWAKGLER